MEAETSAGKEKAGFLAPLASALPPSGPCLGIRCSIRFASELSEGDALSDNLADCKIETLTVVHVLAIVKPKHLLIQVSEQMKRLYADVGSSS